MNGTKTAVNAAIVGKPATEIAKLAGTGAKYPLSLEKLSPVLAMVKAKSQEDAFVLCENMLEFGLGHTASVHTTNLDVELAFGMHMRANRILINSPAALGGIEDIYNEKIPPLTLDCGSQGKNSTSRNVSAVNLINVKTLARRRKNMQWFRLPSRIFFEKNSLQYLRSMYNVERVFLVCDPGMVKLGYADLVTRILNTRDNDVSVRIFSEVDLQPYTIIALDGGSAIDAAKGM